MISVTEFRQNGSCTCVMSAWIVFRLTLKRLVMSVLTSRKSQKCQMDWVVRSMQICGESCFDTVAL